MSGRRKAFFRAVEQFKRELLELALADAGGNKTRAACALGMSRANLYKLLRTLRIPPKRKETR